MNIFESVANPRSMASGGILLDVTLAGGLQTEFFASPDDTVDHGMELYTRAISGEFGEVVPYQKTDDELLHDAQAVAFQRLVESDMVAIRCLKSGVTFPEEWISYVNELRGVVRADAWGAGIQIPSAPNYPSGTE